MPDRTCPHCGQSNEEEREVCWACFKMLKPHEAEPKETPAVFPDPVETKSTTKIVVNGQEYARIEDVPEPLQSIVRNDVQSAQQGMASGKRSRIVVNGVEYERIDDVPEPLRTKLRDGLSHAKPTVVKITKTIKRE